MFKMKTWKGKTAKIVGWVLMKLRMIDEGSYFNTLLTIRAYKEGLRVVKVPLKSAT